LTDRERQILLFLVARYSDREIAEALCISYRTVTTHVANILGKLGVNSRREAAAVAVHHLRV
jgi:DNA-binding CsgD family transcriptional regulator